jgi:hypothetical protein
LLEAIRLPETELAMSNAKVDGEVDAGPAASPASQPHLIPVQDSASAPGAPPPERDSDTLTPLAPDAPYIYADLDDKTFHSTLSHFVKQAQGQYADSGLTLYYRVLPGLQDAQRRFIEHEGDPQYRLDGCSGIEGIHRGSGPQAGSRAQMAAAG